MRVVAARTWKALMCDRVFGHAAELGFYFLFALFPTLLCAGSILGLAARSAYQFYDKLLDYLAVVIPTAAALGTVLSTFNETTAAATTGKVTFGLISAIWSASVGISAIQDTLRIENSRSYIVARIQAIGLTILLTFVVTLGLASMLGGDYFARLVKLRTPELLLRIAATASIRLASWTVASALLALMFAVLYYWAPDCKTRRWHWLTPGGVVGIIGWLLASLGLRLPAFFPQLHRDVWVPGGGDHPADMVLHHRVYAAAGGRDQRVDRSRRRRENPAGANGWFSFVPGRAV